MPQMRTTYAHGLLVFCSRRSFGADVQSLCRKEFESLRSSEPRGMIAARHAIHVLTVSAQAGAVNEVRLLSVMACSCAVAIKQG